MEIKPAILYREEIQRKGRELYYSTDGLYYRGYIGNCDIEVTETDNEGRLFQWAVIDGSKLIGFISYQIDWYSSNAYAFGLISFDKGNPGIGYAMRQIMNHIIKTNKIHRIEWRCVGGNPVKRHYDFFCEQLKGRCFELFDVIKDTEGKYHNEYIYEVILPAAESEE
ncbi:MAG: hypothetical protein IJH36_00530 [Clostridia bacterium]|nr:hypothetical protein [Clostridia bacterium]MBQ3461592.1 hypothetical protein [Clostridia bacterium]